MSHLNDPHEHGHTHPHSHSHHDDHDDSGSIPASHQQATVIATFDLYLQSARADNQARRASFYSASAAHQQLLAYYPALLAAVDARLKLNADVVQQMILPSYSANVVDAQAPTSGDHERLRSTLRQLVRDWSDEGTAEREAVYTPILQALDDHYPSASPQAR